ncbi:MAG: MmcQ/YjbR family DNA-binding protein [Saprospiraceae bacterium]
MISADTFRNFALSLPETAEEPHHEITSFRVKRKIFATLNPPHNRATLRFSPELQDVFSSISKGAIFPVPNKWGHYGWTHINLETIEWELFKDALRTAWHEVAPKALRDKYPDLEAEPL